ncbi:MAG: hypothetical protein ACFBSC_03025 [Microcoleaceae cyanobacterium]
MISTPKLHVSDKLFWEICQQNPELRLERTATGELILTSPLPEVKQAVTTRI